MSAAAPIARPPRDDVALASPGSPATPPPRPRHRLAAWAALVLGAAGAVVLATTGSPLWGAVRAVAAVAIGVGLALLLRRAGARTAGWTAVLVGAVALPAAGVVAGDRLAAGTLPPGVAAATAALAAAVLLVLGTVALLRATPRWWRLAAVPVALVLLQFVVAPVGLAVLTTNRVPADLGSATPADRGLEYVDVTLTTADGTELAAWYVPAANGAAVLLLHGSGSTRASTLDHAEALAALGYSVLMVDARGHGASGGTAMSIGWHGAEDLAAAVDWLDARPDAEAGRIGAVGLSMGGEEAVTLAAREVRVRAVVAEGVGVRVAGDVADAGGFPDLVNRWTYTLTDVLTAASPPEPLPDEVARLGDDQRVLLIAGTGEGEQAEWYAAAAPDRVEVWDLPGVPHTRALDQQPEAWVAHVGDFLAEALG